VKTSPQIRNSFCFCLPKGPAKDLIIVGVEDGYFLAERTLVHKRSIFRAITESIPSAKQAAALQELLWEDQQEELVAKSIKTSGFWQIKKQANGVEIYSFQFRPRVGRVITQEDYNKFLIRPRNSHYDDAVKVFLKRHGSVKITRVGDDSWSKGMA
jgi:hypothetical protein